MTIARHGRPVAGPEGSAFNAPGCRGPHSQVPPSSVARLRAAVAVLSTRSARLDTGARRGLQPERDARHELRGVECRRGVDDAGVGLCGQVGRCDRDDGRGRGRNAGLQELVKRWSREPVSRVQRPANVPRRLRRKRLQPFDLVRLCRRRTASGPLVLRYIPVPGDDRAGRRLWSRGRVDLLVRRRPLVV
jgi:hypothetical protein